jgi:hypothetical protein
MHGLIQSRETVPLSTIIVEICSRNAIGLTEENSERRIGIGDSIKTWCAATVLEAEFLDVILNSQFSSLLFTSNNGFYPSSPTPSKGVLKLFVIKLYPENSSLRTQRNCTFMNSASGLYGAGVHCASPINKNTIFI